VDTEFDEMGETAPRTVFVERLVEWHSGELVIFADDSKIITLKDIFTIVYFMHSRELKLHFSDEKIHSSEECNNVDAIVIRYILYILKNISSESEKDPRNSIAHALYYRTYSSRDNSWFVDLAEEWNILELPLIYELMNCLDIELELRPTQLSITKKEARHHLGISNTKSSRKV